MLRKQFSSSEILSLLKEGVIIEVYREEGEFISTILPEPDNGSYRMILNLNPLMPGGNKKVTHT